MLNELEELAKEGEKFVTKLSGDVYFSDTLIHEMEEKSRQPPTTFLLGIEETLNMCKVEFQQQHVFSGLEKKLNAFSKKHLILQETVRVFREDLPQQLEVNNVTLDPDTAHCNLMVSDRQKKLTSTKNKRVLTDYPQRFIFSPCVLGCEAFTSGRHYWEMDVGKEGYWAVGVARESVERKEYIQIKSDEGIWALEKACSSSLTADSVTLQCNPACLRTIGIYLNYGKNRVCFFDAQRRNILHTFHSASFKDEKIRPFFWLKNGDRAQAQCWIWLSY
ncbi:E3 ubiquitin-protein ligase TRIM15-like [Elgaria multicarinata webbii]|uniref:E3 ubiquitin-protein ligase TRIM15-like n=1 Tax=Elgaria multicarinata webbii TaxID=159646 RepID=UPI002FCCE7EE